MKRLTALFTFFDPSADDETAGMTIDVLAGIVAGIALVLALLLLAAVLKPGPAAALALGTFF